MVDFNSRAQQIAIECGMSKAGEYWAATTDELLKFAAEIVAHADTTKQDTYAALYAASPWEQSDNSPYAKAKQAIMFDRFLNKEYNRLTPGNNHE